jgi:replicative DNA helicase
VAIDYIQIMHGENGGTRENEVSQISGANRELAKSENCAVLELSQLNRKVEERPDKRPIMADLRESGAIEQDSFGILMLYREDYYRGPEAIPDNKAEILIRKIRQYGSCGVVCVEFDGARTHFFELPGAADEFNDFSVDNGYTGGF